MTSPSSSHIPESLPGSDDHFPIPEETAVFGHARDSSTEWTFPLTFVTDKFGDIHHAGPTTEDFLIPCSSLLGSNLLEFLPEAERDSFAAWLQDSSAPPSQSFSHGFCLPDGDRASCLSFRQLFADSRTSSREVLTGHKRVRTSGELFLITSWPRGSGPATSPEAHKAEDIDALAHEDRLASLGGMTANLIHELKQPLSTVSLYAASCLRFLRLDEPDQAEMEDALLKLQHQIDYANAVIRRMRDFASSHELRAEPCDLNDIVRQALALCASLLREEQVQVVEELHEPLPQTKLDGTAITQVLVNLLRNAVEAMRDTPPQEKIIRIQSKSTSTEVQLAISDNGPGIPPSVARNLFASFRTTKKNGMGIGLALCRSLVELHQGRIWAVSKRAPHRKKQEKARPRGNGPVHRPGRQAHTGTTFFVCLPLLKPRSRNGN